MRGEWAGGGPSVRPVHSRPNVQHRKGAGLLWAWAGERSDARLCHDRVASRKAGWCSGLVRGWRVSRAKGQEDGRIGRLADGRRADGMNGRGRRNCIQAELELDLIAAASPGAHGCVQAGEADGLGVPQSSQAWSGGTGELGRRSTGGWTAGDQTQHGKHQGCTAPGRCHSADTLLCLSTVVCSVHTNGRRPAHLVVSANSAASSASVYSSFPRPATEGSKETDRELLRTIGPMFHFSLAAGPCRV